MMKIFVTKMPTIRKHNNQPNSFGRGTGKTSRIWSISKLKIATNKRCWTIIRWAHQIFWRNHWKVHKVLTITSLTSVRAKMHRTSKLLKEMHRLEDIMDHRTYLQPKFTISDMESMRSSNTAHKIPWRLHQALLTRIAWMLLLQMLQSIKEGQHQA